MGTRLACDLEFLEGTAGNDALRGNDGPNTIWGSGGNDVIEARAATTCSRGTSATTSSAAARAATWRRLRSLHASDGARPRPQLLGRLVLKRAWR